MRLEKLSVLQILRNIVGLAVEFALIGAVASLAVYYPWWLAGLTVASIVLIGGALEWARQRHEVPFYFQFAGRLRLVLAGIAGIVESLVKAVAAGVAVILTFAGDESGRTLVLALIFAVCLVIGTGLLRRGYYNHGLRPARWGFFRLAIPLGVLFSLSVQAAVALGFITVPTLGGLAGSLVFDLPASPSVAQLSDLAFNVRQVLDALVVDVAGRLLGETYAPIVAVLVSINLLIGFALAIFVVVILEVVLVVEGGRRATIAPEQGPLKQDPSRKK